MGLPGSWWQCGQLCSSPTSYTVLLMYGWRTQLSGLEVRTWPQLFFLTFFFFHRWRQTSDCIMKKISLVYQLLFNIMKHENLQFYRYRRKFLLVCMFLEGFGSLMQTLIVLVWLPLHKIPHSLDLGSKLVPKFYHLAQNCQIIKYCLHCFKGNRHQTWQLLVFCTKSSDCWFLPSIFWYEYL